MRGNEKNNEMDGFVAGCAAYPNLDSTHSTTRNVPLNSFAYQIFQKALAGGGAAAVVIAATPATATAATAAYLNFAKWRSQNIYFSVHGVICFLFFFLVIISLDSMGPGCMQTESAHSQTLLTPFCAAQNQTHFDSVRYTPCARMWNMCICFRREEKESEGE